MTTNIKHLRCLYATNCGMAEILYLRLVRTVFHDCKIAIIPKNEKLLTYVKSIINNWHEVIALHFHQLSLVQATNSNSRGDQSPFNRFDFLTCKAITTKQAHTQCVPLRIPTSTFRKSTIPLTMDFSKR
jgi:hypothetical protein